ncbi:uncharacterized protein TNCV_870381 [Trichonephila clavipes]|nr:uncharacterized protein TNCV_870381 [Trichonephila clavipes]
MATPPISTSTILPWERGRKYSPVPCTRDSAHKTFGPTDLTSMYSVCTRRIFGGIVHRTQAFRSGVQCSNHQATHGPQNPNPEYDLDPLLPVDPEGCLRNREEAAARGRQCLRKCASDADCISSRKRCLCDGLCGWSCIRPAKKISFIIDIPREPNAARVEKPLNQIGNYYKREMSTLLLFSQMKDGDRFNSCQVIYSQFGLEIHQNDHQAKRRFVEWAQNEIAVVLDFHKRILFSDEAHFWLNGYVNKQKYRICSEANP